MKGRLPRPGKLLSKKRQDDVPDKDEWAEQSDDGDLENAGDVVNCAGRAMKSGKEEEHRQVVRSGLFPEFQAPETHWFQQEQQSSWTASPPEQAEQPEREEESKVSKPRKSGRIKLPFSSSSSSSKSKKSLKVPEEPAKELAPQDSVKPSRSFRSALKSRRRLQDDSTDDFTPLVA